MAYVTDRTDGSLRLAPQERVICVALPMLVTLATGARGLPGVFDGGLINPDSYMRMVRLDETLRQGVPAYVVAQDGSGNGTLLHWSHLIDSLLCLLAAPFHLLLPPDAALHAAAMLFGPLCIGGLGLALAWAVAPVADARWRWLASLSASLATPTVIYGLPGVVHHHVLLVVVAVMTAACAVRGALGLATARTSLAMGAWGGLGIWLSPESMPFTLMAFAGLWLAWTLQPRRTPAALIAGAAAGFLLVVGGALAVDPPYAGYAAAEIDRVSIVYLALAGCIAALATMSLALQRLAGPLRIAACLGLPVLGLGLWLALFPSVLHGTDGLLSEQETRAMFGGISEMLPVRGAAETVEFLMTGALSAAALAWFAVTRRSLLLGYAALCAGILVALGATHVRFAAYPAAAAAAMLPILVTRSNATLANRPEALQAGVRIALIALFALVPHADGLSDLFAPTATAARENTPNCALKDGADLLAKHAGAIVMASPNDAPELLYRTDVRTVGSLYHRNAAAFMRLRAAWRSPPSDTVPDAVRATGATLVLNCPSLRRSLLVADLPPDTLLDRLNRGQVPPWLRQLREDPRSGHVLYEVMP